jgi:hypothetical protein
MFLLAELQPLQLIWDLEAYQGVQGAEVPVRAERHRVCGVELDFLVILEVVFH